VNELLQFMKEITENNPEFFEIIARFFKKYMVTMETEGFSREEAMECLKLLLGVNE